METTQTTQMQVTIKYGLIGSLLLIIAGMALYMMGVMSQTVSNVTNLVIMSIAIVLGIRTYRDEGLGGSLTFGQGLGTGMLISLLIAVIMVVWTFLFFDFVAPDFKDKILEMSVERMSEQGMDDEAIDQAMEQAAFFFSTTFFAIAGSVFFLLLGLVISLISSAIIQKKAEPVVDYNEDILDSSDSN